MMSLAHHGHFPFCTLLKFLFAILAGSPTHLHLSCPISTIHPQVLTLQRSPITERTESSSHEVVLPLRRQIGGRSLHIVIDFVVERLKVPGDRSPRQRRTPAAPCYRPYLNDCKINIKAYLRI